MNRRRHTDAYLPEGLPAPPARVRAGTNDPGGPPPVEVPTPSPPHPPGDAPGTGEPGVPMPDPDPPRPPVPDPERPGIITDLLGVGRFVRAPACGGTTFCALCWGAGAIRRPAANGEGLVPVACAHCGGTGRV